MRRIIIGTLAGVAVMVMNCAAWAQTIAPPGLQCNDSRPPACCNSPMSRGCFIAPQRLPSNMPTPPRWTSAPDT